MKFRTFITLSLRSVLSVSGEPTVKLCLDGTVVCSESGIAFRPTIVDKGWSYVEIHRTSHAVEKKGERLTCGFAAVQKNKPLATFDLSVAKEARGVEISSAFKIASSRYLEALMLVCTLPENWVAGGTYSPGGQAAKPYPVAGKQVQFKATRLVCSAPNLPDAVFASASSASRSRSASGSVSNSAARSR